MEPRRVRIDHAAVAGAAVGAVVLWMLVRRRTPSRLDAGEFAACVLLLAMAVGYVGASEHPVVYEMRDAARAWWGAALERFAPEDDGAGAGGDEADARTAALADAKDAVLDDASTRTAIESARDTLMGSLGRVVTLLHRGGTLRPDAEANQDTTEDRENMVLDADVYPEAVRRQYRMISAWWCQMRATAPRTYDDLMSAALSRVGGRLRPRAGAAAAEEEAEDDSP